MFTDPLTSMVTSWCTTTSSWPIPTDAVMVVRSAPSVNSRSRRSIRSRPMPCCHWMPVSLPGARRMARSPIGPSSVGSAMAKPVRANVRSRVMAISAKERLTTALTMVASTMTARPVITAAPTSMFHQSRFSPSCRKAAITARATRAIEAIGTRRRDRARTRRRDRSRARRPVVGRPCAGGSAATTVGIAAVVGQRSLVPAVPEDIVIDGSGIGGRVDDGSGIGGFSAGGLRRAESNHSSTPPATSPRPQGKPPSHHHDPTDPMSTAANTAPNAMSSGRRCRSVTSCRGETAGAGSVGSRTHAAR